MSEKKKFNKNTLEIVEFCWRKRKKIKRKIVAAEEWVQFNVRAWQWFACNCCIQYAEQTPTEYNTLESHNIFNSNAHSTNPTNTNTSHACEASNSTSDMKITCAGICIKSRLTSNTDSERTTEKEREKCVFLHLLVVSVRFVLCDSAVNCLGCCIMVHPLPSSMCALYSNILVIASISFFPSIFHSFARYLGICVCSTQHRPIEHENIIVFLPSQITSFV